VQALWELYFKAMDGVGFADDRPLYLASGLNTYLNASGAGVRLDAVSLTVHDRGGRSIFHFLTSGRCA
jgi:hypothetical protein